MGIPVDSQTIDNGACRSASVNRRSKRVQRLDKTRLGELWCSGLLEFWNSGSGSNVAQRKRRGHL